MVRRTCHDFGLKPNLAESKNTRYLTTITVPLNLISLLQAVPQFSSRKKKLYPFQVRTCGRQDELMGDDLLSVFAPGKIEAVV